ncbi:rho GTPase-activating protein 6-like isoform X3 [Zophobas morio]|uniref:rho GTPase-activating protein 6-like isoform X3 n=1 Tax=Zophobas morio TaxID=2755281 RepID=UPI0030830759
MITVARSDVEVARSVSFKPFALMGIETTSQYVQKTKTVAVATGQAMQKSKSSSSVMHHGSRLMAKKIFRSRSKSQTRPSQATCSWTPQGGCVWSNLTGRQVVLGVTTLLQLTDVERKVLQKVALAKLQALNLGVAIKVPTETVGAAANKPKRRPYLLKRKALTTSIFDTNRKEGDKEGNSTTGGLVFGIPLTQCVENDRLSRAAARTSPFRSRPELSGSGEEPATIGRHGSRSSFSSLIEAPRGDESGSCESLMLRERLVGSVPGLLDTLSCGSTADLPGATQEEEASVPNILHACFRHIEQHGLRTLGIFRVSTSKKRIRQLREDFDCGKETTLDDDQCPHDVATLLKEYLRDLPDPLLCRDLYQAFVQTQRIRNRRLQFEALQHLIQLLPAANRDTLYALLSFLAMVAQNATDVTDEAGECISGNKMDSNNLATVFAPNILHCIKPGSSRENAADRPEDRIDIINVVRTLIDHYKQLYCISADLLDEIYVHMMDSHPEALDQLLNKRDAISGADESVEELDSESYSAPWSPTAPTSEMSIDNAQTETEPKKTKTISREDFLHERAATSGHNPGMRMRHSKEQIKKKSSKKRRDESVARKKKDEEASSIGSGITTAMNIISRLRGQKDDDYQYSKTRSSSMESTSSTHTDSDLTRALRITDDERRKSSPYVLDNSGVITVSLTIPVQTVNQQCPLNVDDDIPYIEDVDNGRQQLTIGLTNPVTVVNTSPTAPPRRRQRSISGSDSSIGSMVQAIPGSISLVQGYDSAVGSSATYSSPVQNTPPSVSSSIADQGAYSSPPSWASSTPPTSPDSVQTVNYIPDELQTQKTPRIQKNSSSVSLQKVTFSSTQEVQQIKKTYHKEQDIQKSYSVTTFEQIKSPDREPKHTPSISNIGNVVLKSRTENFEKITKVEVQKPAKTSSEKKKYTKRRYTDSRHQTRHIPDAEALDAASSPSKKDETTTAAQTGPVYKRRELISSVPSK